VLGSNFNDNADVRWGQATDTRNFTGDIGTHFTDEVFDAVIASKIVIDSDAHAHHGVVAFGCGVSFVTCIEDVTQEVFGGRFAIATCNTDNLRLNIIQNGFRLIDELLA